MSRKKEQEEEEETWRSLGKIREGFVLEFVLLCEI